MTAIRQGCCFPKSGHNQHAEPSRYMSLNGLQACLLKDKLSLGDQGDLAPILETNIGLPHR